MTLLSNKLTALWCFVQRSQDIMNNALVQSLQLAGYAVDAYENGLDAIDNITRNMYSVVITDIKMPTINGIELLLKVLEIDPVLPTIVITGHGDVSTAVNAMRSGAYDFIEKPFAAERLNRGSISWPRKAAFDVRK